MSMYYYNLKTIHRNYWCCGFLYKYGELLDKSYTLSEIRMKSLDTPNITNGGWHLSYFGDISFIQNKLREFAHVEYRGNEYTDENFIKNKIDFANSLFDRNNESGITKQSIKDNTYPPLYYKTFLSKYVLY